MHSLEFAHLLFSLAFIWYFIVILSSLDFGVAIYILCHYILEVCNLLFDFDFYR